MEAYSVITVFVLLLFLQSALCKFEIDVHAAVHNYTADANDLMLAIYAMSDPDKSTISRMLISRTNAEVQMIKKKYKLLYKEDAAMAIEIRLSGDFQELVLALMTASNEFYARQLHAAIAGLGTDEAAITEILVPMNNSEVTKTNAIYKKLYGTSLREDLIDDTSDFFQELVVALCDGLRHDDDMPLDPDAAVLDAKALRDAVTAPNYLQSHTFITVFTTRSFPQLSMIFDEYTKYSKSEIRVDMRAHLYGDFLNGLLDIANYAYCKYAFFAEKLEISMDGLGTNDEQLIRIVVGRSERDLPKIREIYQNIYGLSLVDRITDDTSGKYTYLLCNLVKRKLRS